MRILITGGACFIGSNLSRRARAELGWTLQEDIQTGLRKAVRWYLDGVAFTNSILVGSYRLERLCRD